MRSGTFYTHDRFMDVYFVVQKAGFYGVRWKIKISWFIRGVEIGVVQKIELSREKALEFTPCQWDGTVLKA